MEGRAAILTAIVSVLAAGRGAEAQPLATRHYDVADGLGHNQINRILQDSRGFVWIATYEGLSRFDGYSVRTYGVRDGFPHAIVDDIVEDHYHHLWVGFFAGGVARVVDESAATKFERHAVSPNERTGAIIGMTVAADGAIWCITDDGAYRGMPARDGHIAFLRNRPLGSRNERAPMLGDRHGRVWFGVDYGLIVVSGGESREWTRTDLVGSAMLRAIVEDRNGRILAANDRGIFELMEEPAGLAAAHWRKIPVTLAAAETISAIHIDRSGRLWIGTSQRLLVAEAGRPIEPVGLSNVTVRVRTVYEDAEGNLWIGTAASGVFVAGVDHVTTVTVADGPPGSNVRKVVEGPQGRIFASTVSGLAEIVAGGATLLPGGDRDPGGWIDLRLLRDRQGDWWVGSGPRLFHIRGPEPRLDRAAVVLRGLDAPPGSWTGPQPYEDAGGAIWVTGPDRFVFRIRRETDGTLHPEAVPVSDTPLYAARIAVDRAGDLWLGSYGNLVRRRTDGRIDAIHAQPGLPETLVRSLMVDSRGWLWVGLRYGGVSMSRQPDAERPQFQNYSTADGLASDTVWALCEGDRGRIYLGTGRGLDRFDPSTGVVRHFSGREGFIATQVISCTRDSRGRIWVATMAGLWRLDPAGERPLASPAVYLMRLRVAGEEIPLPQRGVATMSIGELPVSSGGLVADFVAPSAGRTLRYQYYLDGADRQWSPPTDNRSVNVPRLAAGSYRLLVRAVDEGGVASSQPATLEFRVLPPVWRRWWFVALAITALSALALALHRMRVRQILALEQVRRQVAIDLHDDVGSGLTEIAMLSEAAKDGAARGSAALLDETAGLARSLRESMSDIVWAVDPRKDRVVDLVRRMREVGFHLLEGNGLRVDFQAPDERQIAGLQMTPDRRRHVLLMFKEAVTNIARHSGASAVRIDLRIAPPGLRLTIGDNGCGFRTDAEYDGHGLHNLRTRAAEAGARLSIESTEGVGTTIEVQVALR